MESDADVSLARRVHQILDRIRRAAERAGRLPDTVRLVAATKTVPAERIREGLGVGLAILGENRMQEALSKVALLRDLSPRWHFIGQLQRRKVRDAIGTFELIHSVDSVELAQEINRRAGDVGVKQAVLLEVNIAGEASKAGFSPQVLTQELGLLGDLPHLRIQGLMTIPPPTERPEDARPFFRDLRELGARIAAQRISSVVMQEYSMGMSHDFEVAIEEGATLVRVGTAIFGARNG
ncbi:MAG: YggS family pyridoxal phosphate-dependent enzyme [Nitrospira sp. CG24D]|nr:MAG: YggS family pyridoxal phosphate-dependent enzyme [Nitrospira sp. CG24D]TKB81287.1 MAG: YggS family pyridoxal phosphate-dependent enzyme [Nitrospira sp.]